MAHLIQLYSSVLKTRVLCCHGVAPRAKPSEIIRKIMINFILDQKMNKCKYVKVIGDKVHKITDVKIMKIMNKTVNVFEAFLKTRDYYPLQT